MLLLNSALFILCLVCWLPGTSSSRVLTRREGPQCSRSVDVAVVGAGPSGTYSAYKLRNKGQTVELFEYSNRIGGRLFTTHLPNVPDLNLESGGMRYFKNHHKIFGVLVKELNLSNKEFTEGFGKPGRTRFFARGKSLTLEEMTSGDVPYNLSTEEKANQANLAGYYLKKLTGFDGEVLTIPQANKLEVDDGRKLYQLTVDEALDKVGTPEGKEFLKAFSTGNTEFIEGVSAVNYFLVELGEREEEILTLTDGMSALPQALADAFLKSSTSHALTLNRKLQSLSKTDNGLYLLEFLETNTHEGYTEESNITDLVCARKVILAIPQSALIHLDWKPLRSETVNEAFNAVKFIPTSKVFLTFPTAWWLSDAVKNPAFVVKSTSPFNQMYDWKSSNVTGDAAMIASYADTSDTKFQENLNSKGELIPGSAPGANRVTVALKEELLSQLSQAYGIERSDIPEPKSGTSQFWSSYPFEGDWTVWKAGYHCEYTQYIIERPSLIDDVFVVGSDHVNCIENAWTESAFLSVENVFEKYF
uniref:Achacin n=1 Tax=Lissachatina fulica TaxID=2315439 RepID=ACHC_LISFU|nr:RecName: Full=Achacin; Flags: Precursor [Lissachatina fulica]CAA45871.1 achacin [Lissachatina fulica]